MSFQYTQAQIDDIYISFSAVDYPTAYRKAASYAENQPGVQPEAIMWLRGAADINENNGSYFDDFVRGYTSSQYLARFGVTAPSTGPGSIQAASNTIATNILDSIVRTKTVPTIATIADHDALPVAESLFGESGGFAGGWAGNPLFLGLGINMVPSNVSETASDTYDSLAFVKFTESTVAAPDWDTLVQYSGMAATHSGTIAAGFTAVATHLAHAYGRTFASLEAIANNVVLGTLISGDELSGSGGDDIIHGGLGNDTLQGSSGDDILDGGAGEDAVDFAGGSAIEVEIRSEPARHAGFVAEVVGGGTSALFSIETIAATAGDDEFKVVDIPATATPLLLLGGAGNDTFDVSAFQDGVTIDAPQGSFSVDAGHLTLFSFEAYKTGAGDDNIALDALATSVIAGSGNDTISSMTDELEIDAGEGDDILTFQPATSGVEFYIEAEFGIETVIGSSYGDTFQNGTNVQGYLGDDVIFGSEGDDTLRGDEGNDSITGGFGGDDDLHGGAGDDLLIAADESYLDGGDGNDSLHGGNGFDIIFGGDGNDTLSGGAGSELNNYLMGEAGNDRYLLGPYDNAEDWSGHDTYVVPLTSGYTSDSEQVWVDGLSTTGRVASWDTPRVKAWNFDSDADTLEVNGQAITSLEFTEIWEQSSSSSGFHWIAVGRTNTAYDFILKATEVGWYVEGQEEPDWRMEVLLSFTGDLDQYYDPEQGLNPYTHLAIAQDSVIASVILEEGDWENFGIGVSYDDSYSYIGPGYGLVFDYGVSTYNLFN